MRSLFLLLLLANLVFFALRFDVVRGLIPETSAPTRLPSVNAERLRVVRDAPPATPASAPGG